MRSPGGCILTPCGEGGFKEGGEVGGGDKSPEGGARGGNPSVYNGIYIALNILP
jgi:hypothetical protein